MAEMRHAKPGPLRHTYFGPFVIVCDLQSRQLAFGGETEGLTRELVEYERAGRYLQLATPLETIFSHNG